MHFRTGPEEKWIEFDSARLLVTEARLLESLTGMGLKDFGEGLQRGKVDALVFMVFLGNRRSGVAVRWEDFDDLDITNLEIRDEEPSAEDAPAKEAGEARPTTAARKGGKAAAKTGA